MAVKRKYVIATSDIYPDGTVRPAEELEAAAKRIDRIPLTLGHPSKDNIGPPDEDMLIGTVTQYYDKRKKRLVGDFFFFDEYWDRIPERLRQDILAHKNIPISPGFKFSMLGDNQITKIVPHHLAVLTDEKPICPLNKCGINVPMNEGLTMKYEMRTEAENPEKPDSAKKTESYDPVSLGIVIGEMKAEIAQLRKQLEARPVPQKQEAQEQETDAEPSEPSPPETPRVTKRVLPAGEVKAEDELEVDERGMIVLS